MNTNNQATIEPQEGLPVGQILVGDASTKLRSLPAGSVDTVVTSPPYFRLRNYGEPNQIGLEESVDDWVQALRTVMGEVARVLKPQGSVWLNLGDTYSRSVRHGASPKSLVLGPERLLLALEADGWLVRNKVVWSKPNPMPASVRDRLACTWEPIYLLTRSPDYFFDLDAIRVPARSSLNRPTITGTATKYGTGVGRPEWSGPSAGTNSGLEKMKARGLTAHPLGKNPGDVWTMPTAAYRGAHFATFPESLVERPLKATCPQRVCRACGLAWRRASVVRDLGMLAVKGQLRKSCACESRDWQPGVVLDPFMGAGTVGVVAARHDRRWIGIELSDRFAALARNRIATTAAAAQEAA